MVKVVGEGAVAVLVVVVVVVVVPVVLLLVAVVVQVQVGEVKEWQVEVVGAVMVVVVPLLREPFHVNNSNFRNSRSSSCATSCNSSNNTSNTNMIFSVTLPITTSPLHITLCYLDVKLHLRDAQHR